MSEPALQEGTCFFIDDQKEWKQGHFYFVRDHVLEIKFEDDGGKRVTNIYNSSVYNINRALVGDFAYLENEEWEPTNRTPGEGAQKCTDDTLVLLPHRRNLNLSLWIQFPILDDFCNFYEYWLNNVRLTGGSDDAAKGSYAVYEILKNRLVEPIESRPAWLVPIHQTALCFFIDDQKEEWKEGNYSFIRDHDLELGFVNDKGILEYNVINKAIYDTNRAIVGVWTGRYSDGWRPLDKTPGPPGKKCSLETIVAIPHRRNKNKALWLQFRTFDIFCKFYEYWLEKVRTQPTGDEASRESIKLYEGLKQRILEPPEEPFIPPPVIVRPAGKPEPALLQGLCFFIDDKKEEWKKGYYSFVRDHALELDFANDKGEFVGILVDPADYNTQRCLVGFWAHYFTDGWKPENKSPTPCSIETLVSFPHKRSKDGTLWLQFKTLAEYCIFYEYWMMNVRKELLKDKESICSLAVYEDIKKRVLNPPPAED